MSGVTTRKVQCNGNGQWTITIPAEYARILNLKSGDVMEFSISTDGSGEIHMRRHVE